MRAVVLGATGHVGNAVVRELLGRGWEVTATSRRPRPAANLDGLAVRYDPGHGDLPGQFEAWFRGQDLVVDAAAPYPLHLFHADGPAERRPREHAAHRCDTLLAAVEGAGARLAYVSSFTTLPRRRGRLEAWGAAAARRLHPYYGVKQLIEERVLAAARRGLPAAIVNPVACLGPWDLKPRRYCLIPLLLRGEVPVIIQEELNVIDVRDVARALVAAVEAERWGEPIPLSGHDVTVDELVDRICRLGGAAPPRLRVPSALGLAATLSAEPLWALAGRPSPSPALATLLARESAFLPPSEAQRALGIWPRSLSSTLADAIDWYRRLGYC